MTDKPQTYPWIVSCKWADPVDWHPIARFAYQRDAIDYMVHVKSINQTMIYTFHRETEQPS